MPALAQWMIPGDSERAAKRWCALALALLLGASGCGADQGPPTSQPVSAPQKGVHAELVEEDHSMQLDVEKPATNRAALLQALPALQDAPGGPSLEAARTALDISPAPCGLCEGKSIGACAVAHGAAACPPVDRLVARAVRLAEAGARHKEIFDWIQLPDLWFPDAVGGELGAAIHPTEVRIELWIEPDSSFLPDALALLDLLTADPRVNGRVQLLDPGEEAGPDPLSLGFAAADLQGLGDPWARALAVRRGPSPVAGEHAQVAEELAQGLVAGGLELARWQTDLQGTAVASVGEGRIRAQRLGIQATPTWFIDGHRLRGAQSRLTLMRIVDSELSDLPPAPPAGG